MAARLERATAEAAGTTIEERIEKIRSIESVCGKQLQGTRYLDRNGNPIDSAQTRFEWASRRLEYDAVFRALSSSTHPYFPIKNVEGRIEWPRLSASDYPLVNLDSSIRILLSSAHHAFSAMDAEVEPIRRLTQRFEEFCETL